MDDGPDDQGDKLVGGLCLPSQCGNKTQEGGGRENEKLGDLELNHEQ